MLSDETYMRFSDNPDLLAVAPPKYIAAWLHSLFRDEEKHTCDHSSPLLRAAQDGSLDTVEQRLRAWPLDRNAGKYRL